MVNFINLKTRSARRAIELPFKIQTSPDHSWCNTKLVFLRLCPFYELYGSETHLREVAYCDVIKRQMTSLLTLSDDFRQNETFKEKVEYLLSFSLNSG